MVDGRTARIYLWGGVAGMLAGGLLAVVMRWNLAYPGAVTTGTYTRLFTLHGLVMIFFGVTPIILGALGTGVLPGLVGAEHTRFPRLGLSAAALFLLGIALVALSAVVDLGTGDAGWTGYAPLSTAGTPGHGQTVLVAAILVAALSGIPWGINVVATVVTHRRRAWLDLPLTAWGLFLSGLLVCLFHPFLVAATTLTLLDRAGQATAGALLYQHLFWLFGHPEVYALILPAWGVIGDLVARASGRAPFWYRGSVGAMIAVTALSGLVYGHHMFVTGLAPGLAVTFEAFTLGISVPSAILLLNWLGTLATAPTRPTLTPATLYALGAIVTFAYGGLSGVLLGSIPLDGYLHGTMYVVGHFHLTLASAVLFGLFAAVTHWFIPTAPTRLLRAHFFLTLPLLLAVFTGQLAAGFLGQLRRVSIPTYHAYVAHLAPLHVATTHAALALAATQLLFLLALLRGRTTAA